jgi:hypothetical protein
MASLCGVLLLWQKKAKRTAESGNGPFVQLPGFSKTVKSNGTANSVVGIVSGKKRHTRGCCSLAGSITAATTMEARLLQDDYDADTELDEKYATDDDREPYEIVEPIAKSRYEIVPAQECDDDDDDDEEDGEGPYEGDSAYADRDWMRVKTCYVPRAILFTSPALRRRMKRNLGTRMSFDDVVDLVQYYHSSSAGRQTIVRTRPSWAKRMAICSDASNDDDDESRFQQIFFGLRVRSDKWLEEWFVQDDEKRPSLVIKRSG